MTAHGKFSDDPQTHWLTEPGQDHKMELLIEFSFTDNHGVIWDAPRSAKIDGASIPRPLWTLVGSPYTGDYRRASIVHDIACDRAGSDKTKRRAADRMFYRACRAGGCTAVQSMLLYLGVRIGAIWHKVPQWSPSLATATEGPRLTRSTGEERMESDYAQAGTMVIAEGVTDDPEDVERRVDAALTVVTQLAVATL